MYGDLGFDFLQTLKEAAAAGITAAKGELLARGGAVIAASPEGQQAIRETLIQRAEQKASAVASGTVFGVPTPIALGVGLVALVLVLRRRGGRR